MSTTPLMRAVVEACVFFGLGDDESINQDVAIQQLEEIATHLRDLSDSEKQEFKEFVEALAHHEEADMGRTERVDFLLTFCENLGLDQ